MSSPEQRFVHGQRSLNKLLGTELDVGESLRVAVHLVAQNGDTVDGSAAVEVRLQLFSGGPVVDVAHVDRAVVDFHFIVNRQSRSRGTHRQWHIHFGLQQFQFLRFLLHFLNPGSDPLQLRINLVVAIILKGERV